MSRNWWIEKCINSQLFGLHYSFMHFQQKHDFETQCLNFAFAFAGTCRRQVQLIRNYRVGRTVKCCCKTISIRSLELNNLPVTYQGVHSSKKKFKFQDYYTIKTKKKMTPRKKIWKKSECCQKAKIASTLRSLELNNLPVTFQEVVSF